MTCRFQSFMPRISTSMLRPFAVACLVAVASLGWTGWAAAAACSSTNYDLDTQAEVDAFGLLVAIAFRAICSSGVVPEHDITNL